ncbi:unnamed protein product [Periconia digitata]|uniref:Ricin B lectin domain-containing protein n=1 Tax=Periconia digitata TaxID=1303443 RepID=A0A9W4XR67_9PLEO|nr:unnamed protein product [Periconia digitata]
MILHVDVSLFPHSSHFVVVMGLYLDQNSWYHLYHKNESSNAMVGTILYDKTKDAGAVYSALFNTSDTRQFWQFYPIDSEYYVLRSQQGGAEAVLGTGLNDVEDTPGGLRPRMTRINANDDSIYWKLTPSGDGSFYFSNKRNQTSWRLARKQGVDAKMIMDSNIEGKSDLQRWRYEKLDTSINNSKFSSLPFPIASSTTSSSGSTFSTGTPPPDPHPKETTSSTDASTGLSTGTKLAIGLSIGLAALIGLIILGLFVWRKRRNTRHPKTQMPCIANGKDLVMAYEIDQDSTVKHELASQQQFSEMPYNPRPVEMPMNLPPAELPSSPLQRR